MKHATVSFTGRLASMSREEAHRLVREAGGEPSSGISRRTSLLVVGMGGWPLLPDGMVGSKLKRAEELIRRGYGIRILSEEGFLELAGRKNRQPQPVPKTYPAAEVCKRLKLSPEALQRWEQFGLIRSLDGLYDFQDLVSLRTIAELIERGVRPETIAKSLQSLASILPAMERPLAQLKIVAQNPKAVHVDLGAFLMTPHGQLLFNFEELPRRKGAIVPLREATSEAEWFEYGQAFEEDENYGEAVEAYRRAISRAPHFPAAWFNLGNALRLLGQADMAAEAYREASTQDAGMAAAWYNLADVQEEQGKIWEAVSSLQSALQACASYADAHFNLALCYEKLEQRREAKRHWEAYLRLDASSQWAKIARSHLAEK
ncbi:MAG: tetratricopeptide repeat protein [Acidobacteria bacterium]|nr:tetratricopeptide repeat protein [Acidobacteriota bacterium]